MPPDPDKRCISDYEWTIRDGFRTPRRHSCRCMSTGLQLEFEVGHIGGILFVMGVLQAANLVALTLTGRLLSSGVDASRPPGEQT